MTSNSFDARDQLIMDGQAYEIERIKVPPVIDASTPPGCILVVPGYRGVATCSSASMSRMVTSRRP